MAAGPEALKQLLKRIEALEVETERITQTLQEENLFPDWWKSDPWADIELWDSDIKAEIGRRIDEWGKRPVSGA